MKKSGLGVLLLLAAPLVHADDAALSKCRAISEAGARLACYDAIPLTSTASAPKAAAGAPAVAGAAPAATPAPASKVTAATYSASVAGTPAPVEERTQPTQAASTAKQAEQFGMEDLRPKDQVQQIESSIAGPFEGWVPHQRIRLTNGQVWQIADDTTHWMSVENPKVVIWRGLFGVFYMNIGTLNQAPRVQRVK